MTLGHWTSVVEDILSAPSGELKNLAKIAGFDPAIFYTGQNLANCDLRGQDLTGMDFTGCNIEKAILDGATKIDPEYDPRIEKGDGYWHFPISMELNGMVLQFMKDEGYTYSAWAYRNLVERAIYSILENDFGFYKRIIDGNNNLLRAVTDIRKVNMVPVRVLLYSEQVDQVEERIERSLTESDGRWFVAVGLLTRKISYGDKRDFSNLSLNAFYPPRLLNVKNHFSDV